MRNNRGSIASKTSIKKGSFTDQVVIFALTGIYLLTRLYHLTTLPIFFDESYFILWAKQIATTNQHWFISLSGQKNVSLIWLVQFFLRLFPNNFYLFSARLASVTSGIISLWFIYKLGSLIAGAKRGGYIAAFLYVFCPFTLFYDRLAEYDSLLTSMLLGSVYFTFKVSKSNKYRDAILWGVFLGLAFLTKATTIIYFFLTPVVFLLLSFKKASAKIFIRLLFLITMALFVSQLFNHSLIVSKGYRFYMDQSLQYTPTLTELQKSPTYYLFKNLPMSLNWLMSYLTWPFFLLSLISLGFLLYQKFRLAACLALLFVVPIFIISFFAKVSFVPRYILFTTPYILVSLAVLLSYLFSKSRWGKVFGLVLLLVVLILPLKFDYLLLTNPIMLSYKSVENWKYLGGFPNANDFYRYTFGQPLATYLPVSDDFQYLSGPPSGFGLDAIYQYLDMELLRGKRVVVVAQGSYSFMPNVLKLRYWGNDNLQVIERWPVIDPDRQIYEMMKSSEVFYLIFERYNLESGKQDLISQLPIQVVAEGKKATGKDSIYLAKLL